VSLLGIFFLVELFLFDSLTHLFVVIYRNRFILAKRVYYLFIYFTANAHVFPREFGGYFCLVFFSYGVSAGISRIPSSSLKKPPFVCFYRHKSVEIYKLISRIICGIFRFHCMKACRMNEKCKAKPTKGESTSQYKKIYILFK
jgi:hypothetical protein